MPTVATQTSIDSVLQENRVFECPEAFRADAHIGSSAEYERLYYQGSQVGFSTLERTLILIFMVAYVLATLGVGVATYLISTHVISRVAF